MAAESNPIKPWRKELATTDPLLQKAHRAVPLELCNCKCKVEAACHCDQGYCDCEVQGLA